jgi:hypothetical protein
VSGVEPALVVEQLRHRRLAAHRHRPGRAVGRAAHHAAARRQVAGDVAERLTGRVDLDVDDRLEDDRPGVAHRRQERLRAGGDEGDLLAVDAVVLAVVDDDAHVDHRMAGDRAGAEHLAHALLHRGMNWPGMVPPLTWSRNSKPEPRGSGSTRRYTSPNWPAPPLCFLCRWWPSALAVIVSR